MLIGRPYVLSAHQIDGRFNSHSNLAVNMNEGIKYWTQILKIKTQLW